MNHTSAGTLLPRRQSTTHGCKWDSRGRTKGVEAVDDDQIVPFHDQGGGGEDTPAHCFGILLDGGHDALVVLMLGGFPGLVDDALEVDRSASASFGGPVPLELGHAAAHVGDGAIIGADDLFHLPHDCKRSEVFGESQMEQSWSDETTDTDEQQQGTDASYTSTGEQATWMST